MIERAEQLIKLKNLQYKTLLETFEHCQRHKMNAGFIIAHDNHHYLLAGQKDDNVDSAGCLEYSQGFAYCFVVLKMSNGQLYVLVKHDHILLEEFIIDSPDKNEPGDLSTFQVLYQSVKNQHFHYHIVTNTTVEWDEEESSYVLDEWLALDGIPQKDDAVKKIEFEEKHLFASKTLKRFDDLYEVKESLKRKRLKYSGIAASIVAVVMVWLLMNVEWRAKDYEKAVVVDSKIIPGNKKRLPQGGKDNRYQPLVDYLENDGVNPYAVMTEAAKWAKVIDTLNSWEVKVVEAKVVQSNVDGSVPYERTVQVIYHMKAAEGLQNGRLEELERFYLRHNMQVSIDNNAFAIWHLVQTYPVVQAFRYHITSYVDVQRSAQLEVFGRDIVFERKQNPDYLTTPYKFDPVIIKANAIHLDTVWTSAAQLYGNPFGFRRLELIRLEGGKWKMNVELVVAGVYNNVA